MDYDLHTTSPILQQGEEQLGKILDTDYSKVDIDIMVNDLDIAQSTKDKLKHTLKKASHLILGRLSHIQNETSRYVTTNRCKTVCC